MKEKLLLLLLGLSSLCFFVGAKIYKDLERRVETLERQLGTNTVEKAKP